MYTLSSTPPAGKQNHYMTQGLWVIIGLLSFLVLEKMFPDQDSHEDPPLNADLNFNSAVSVVAEVACFGNNLCTVILRSAHQHVNSSLHIYSLSHIFEFHHEITLEAS